MKMDACLFDEKNFKRRKTLQELQIFPLQKLDPTTLKGRKREEDEGEAVERKREREGEGKEKWRKSKKAWSASSPDTNPPTTLQFFYIYPLHHTHTT